MVGGERDEGCFIYGYAELIRQFSEFTPMLDFFVSFLQINVAEYSYPFCYVSEFARATASSWNKSGAEKGKRGGALVLFWGATPSSRQNPFRVLRRGAHGCRMPLKPS